MPFWLRNSGRLAECFTGMVQPIAGISRVTNALYSLARARENAVDALFRLNASCVTLARS